MKIDPDYVVYIDVYHIEVGIFRTRKKWDAWHEERGIEVDDRTCYGESEQAIDHDGGSWFIAYIPDECTPDTICHECVHLAYNVLDYVGVPVEAGSSEALAYLAEHLFKSISDGQSMACKKGKRKGK